MSDFESKLIHVQWEGPMSLKEIEKRNQPKDKGLYQIYGGHNVYGSDSLLYIGKTKAQSFAKRIPQHGREFLDWNQDHERLTFYVGWLFGTNSSSNGADIDLIEALLIFAHNPARNGC